MVTAATAAVVAASAPAAFAATAASPKIDLKVLVVTDGGPAVSAISQQLSLEGVPQTIVDLNNASRPQLTAAFLSGTAEAKFQSVVLPNQAPAGLSAAELTALTTYESSYGIRQVDAYVYPTAAVGLNAPSYSGQLDGVTASVTAAGKATGAFPYLSGSVKFEDRSPAVAESYGYLSTPATPATGTSFTPLVTAPIAGSSTAGVLSGVYTSGTRSELVNTFVYNANQHQFQALAHGMVTWMTKGVHLGLNRNYFNVDIDDVFLADDQWNTEAKCTPGDVDCPIPTPGQNGPAANPVRMTPADVDYLANWQKQNNFKFEMLFNGGGSADVIADSGSDPTLTQFKKYANQFHWVNHTYTHEFLGCTQNVTVVPWQCTVDASGNTVYMSQADISSQISQNNTWAQQNGFSGYQDRSELVTGEHSGLFVLPQQPNDNPNLAPALKANGIKWAGADASRQPVQRQLTGSSALTVPRHPVDVYYNVSTAAQEIDEYNWLYTSRADGGSGICTDNPATTTCIAPLNATTGFTDYIVPLNTQIVVGHLLGNDADPHYMHQSNLAGDRLAYSLVGSVLAAYRGEFAANTPVVQQNLAAAGQTMANQAAWQKALLGGTASAYTLNGRVYVSAPSGLQVPITVPDGTTDCGLLCTGILAQPYGTAYSAEKSRWQNGSVTLILPKSATTASTTSTTATLPSTTSAAPKAYVPPAVVTTPEQATPLQPTKRGLSVPTAKSGKPQLTLPKHHR
ncbi:hypothetical protein GCM10010174_08780 [Kutzneria viridogrisea]|uniref:Secreted protein n=2 Tax=Kutzneria TaxID=43356 RepID=W5WJY5_9PSEU|nr:hypothetical protein [Kutzneria albida]AHI01519.1 hypothetical protein KALB_8161 [Kutzneria albida DSM 43870]MBA8931483.1 hypothetical protein [Kutzneria viridogrisea]